MVLETSVENGRITAVTILKHDCGRGKPAEALTGSIVREQSLEVDTITGATISSKAILKAVERSLIKPAP